MEESGEHVKHLERTPPDQGVRWRHGSTVFGYTYLTDIFKIERMSFFTLFFFIWMASFCWWLLNSIHGCTTTRLEKNRSDFHQRSLFDNRFVRFACVLHSFYPVIVRYRQLMDTLSWLVLGVWFFLIESPRLSAMTKTDGAISFLSIGHMKALLYDIGTS